MLSHPYIFQLIQKMYFRKEEKFEIQKFKL
jgi:hypothetical protein